MELAKEFVNPVGYIEQDKSCNTLLNLKTTPSRESMDCDSNFYFENYISPKYGLDNLNASNVVSFMKSFEMNWTHMPPNIRVKVIEFLIDTIFLKDGEMKNYLIQKLVDSSGLRDRSADQVPQFADKISVPPLSKNNPDGPNKKPNWPMIIVLILLIMALAFVAFRY
jgi:hypothetical protein